VRLWLRIGLVAVLFLAALPFMILSGVGVMKPAEGFCMENGFAQYGDAPSEQEATASYFVSPELSHAVQGDDAFSWPICIRSRRGEHRMAAYSNDRDLARLGAANLARLHVDEPATRVLRVLTAPSFSRDPIVIELRGGTLAASWLIDDNPHKDAAADENAWRYASLPVAHAQAEISAEDAEQFWALARRSSWGPPALDGNWLAIEMIAGGRRDVRLVLLQGGPETDLFCRLAASAGVPQRALLIGHVLDQCARLPPQSPAG
jgi:hypothetical protein